MIKSIDADNLYLILPFKVTQMAMLYARKFDVKILDAIKAIYKSNTYRDLEREDTKLWHLGPVALLEYMEEHN